MELEGFEFEHADDESLSALLNDVFVGTGFADGAVLHKTLNPAELRTHGEIVVAKHNCEVVGLCMLVEPHSPVRQVAEHNEAEIHLLAVPSHMRRRGVGSALLRECVGRVANRGFRRVVLATQPMHSYAHGLYQLQGFRRNPARDWMRPGGGHYWVFERDLND
ncbi:MAG: GNAT family N-acetyltransferase [Pseudomonadota bacterium]